jgi:hypothetical protein
VSGKARRLSAISAFLKVHLESRLPARQMNARVD